jgi:ATP-dependent Clp protease adaptor protein ClpS
MCIESITAPCKPQLKRPPQFNVIFFDDDISTFTCVMDILVNYFNKSKEDAYELTMEVHLTGICVAGIYPKDIAKTKISLANAELKNTSYPLNIQLAKSI